MNPIKISNKNEKVLQNLTTHLQSTSHHHGHLNAKKSRRKKKQKLMKHKIHHKPHHHQQQSQSSFIGSSTFKMNASNVHIIYIIIQFNRNQIIIN